MLIGNAAVSCIYASHLRQLQSPREWRSRDEFSQSQDEAYMRMLLERMLELRTLSKLRRAMASSSVLSSSSSLGNLLPASSAKIYSPNKKKRSVRWKKVFSRGFHLKYHNSTDTTSLMSGGVAFDRREVLFSTVGILMGNALQCREDQVAIASQFADMPAIRGKDYGKTKMRYPDYTETESGLQYKDLREGSGPSPKMGETVVVDWDGYTIGYYGRVFEARNKTKGGSFEGDDKDFFKFKLGSQQVIPAFEEAVAGMALGGIRRIVVPPELGYPDNDYNKSAPRPTTFSGQRALDFVLRNQGLIDKTLLFDIELIKIMPN